MKKIDSLRIEKKYYFKVLTVCLVLTVIIISLYWPVQKFEFVDLDDSIYVYDNPFISKGFSPENIIRIFTTTHTANWHPITWISLVLDYELFGLKAGGYHWTNVIIHLVNTILLFFLFNWLTSEMGKSALLALIFALHPLNVESVAWVSERKNVLSMLFWILTIAAYIFYVKKPAFRRYCLMIILFALGLMVKPILVALPLVLVLLDYWPLQRLADNKIGYSNHLCSLDDSMNTSIKELPTKNIFSQNAISRTFHLGKRKIKMPDTVFFLYEKIPLFLLSIASCVITLYAAARGSAIKSTEIFSYEERFANAIVSYVKYIINMFWPNNLVCFYPYPKTLPLLQVITAFIFLAGLTALVIVYAKRHRYLLVGWFWYLICILPVSGIVQVGYQSMADRYTYVSVFGLFIIIIWGGADLLKNISDRNKLFFYAAAVAILIILSVLSRQQIEFWQNGETLFKHALAVTTNNYMAHSGIGKIYMEKGQYEEAKSHFLQAVLINPTYSETRNNLGVVYLYQKKYDDAIKQFREAVRYKPGNVKAYNNMGIAFSMKSNYEEAILCFHNALRINPDDNDAQKNLSVTLNILKNKR